MTSEPKLLQPGDVIDLVEGDAVYADVPHHFLYDNRKGDFTLAHGLARIGGELAYLAGRYVVVAASLEGGGMGHGPFDEFPDGWHVRCEAITDRRRVDFYQSGSFTAMIRDRAPVGRATLRWVLDEDK